MARSMTITEGLAEWKLLGKRVEKKREFIGSYLMRPERLKDPLEKDGGSVSAIFREMQAIGDLEEERIRIRRAIQTANEATRIVVANHTRTIADWLVWRREVGPQELQFLRRVSATIEQQRQEALKRGGRLAAASDEAGQSDIVVNLSERELSERIEELEAQLGALDGQLSLKNATVMIEW